MQQKMEEAVDVALSPTFCFSLSAFEGFPGLAPVEASVIRALLEA